MTGGHFTRGSFYPPTPGETIDYGATTLVQKKNWPGPGEFFFWGVAAPTIRNG